MRLYGAGRNGRQMQVSGYLDGAAGATETIFLTTVKPFVVEKIVAVDNVITPWRTFRQRVAAGLRRVNPFNQIAKVFDEDMVESNRTPARFFYRAAEGLDRRLSRIVPPLVPAGTFLESVVHVRRAASVSGCELRTCRENIVIHRKTSDFQPFNYLPFEVTFRPGDTVEVRVSFPSAATFSICLYGTELGQN